MTDLLNGSQTGAPKGAPLSGSQSESHRRSSPQDFPHRVLLFALRGPQPAYVVGRFLDAALDAWENVELTGSTGWIEIWGVQPSTGAQPVVVEDQDELEPVDEIAEPEPAAEPEPTVFACDECDATFDSRARLQGHFNAHRGPMNNVCRVDGCDERFRSKGRRQDHELLAHGRQPWTESSDVAPTPDPKVPCPECGKEFGTRQALGGHLNAHRASERVFQCEHCGRSFGAAPGLASHQRHCPVEPAAAPPPPQRPAIGESYAEFLARKAVG